MITLRVRSAGVCLFATLDVLLRMKMPHQIPILLSMILALHDVKFEFHFVAASAPFSLNFPASNGVIISSTLSARQFRLHRFTRDYLSHCAAVSIFSQYIVGQLFYFPFSNGNQIFNQRRFRLSDKWYQDLQLHPVHFQLSTLAVVWQERRRKKMKSTRIIAHIISYLRYKVYYIRLQVRYTLIRVFCTGHSPLYNQFCLI